MTEKRYYAHKHLLHEKVHDKICHNFMSLDETVEHMNNQYWKYKQLKEENEQLKYQTAMLKEELEQCKAVIDNRWSEYLKKKELME